MKKIALLLLGLCLLSPQPVNAGAWDKTKQITNKAMFWKKTSLEEVTFSTIYPKKFYKKKSFTYSIIIGSAVIGAATTYLTAGAGAPAVATGMGSVATWAGGGGAGSYMAGLSTIGSVVGGNAITGAAILNGAAWSVGLGSVGKYGALSFASKIALIAEITASAFDGVQILKKPDTDEIIYKVDLRIPENLGRNTVRKIVEDIYELDRKIASNINDLDYIKIQYKNKNELMNSSSNLLEKYIKSSKYSQEDILVLGIIAYKSGKYNLFQDSVNILSSQFEINLEDNGFLLYLKAISNLLDGNIEEARKNLDNSFNLNKYAIEPALLYINLLAEGDNFKASESNILTILNKVEENFDADSYATPYTLASVYYRVATLYFRNDNTATARDYYEKTYDELGWFGNTDLKRYTRIGTANSYYKLGLRAKADEYFEKAIKDIEDDKKDNFKNIYLGSMND